MTLHIPFDNTYAALPPVFYTKQSPVPVKAPELLAYNAALGAELGITVGEQAELAEVFAGNHVPEGAAPLA
ncbi:MAG: hypothetical protein VXZ09_20050, partial [Pseudomonadota bacterium]|nr:hypothetical protein [Pseudomonadota bacterium]